MNRADIATDIKTMALEAEAYASIVMAVYEAMEHGSQDSGLYTQALWLLNQALFEHSEKLSDMAATIKGSAT